MSPQICARRAASAGERGVRAHTGDAVGATRAAAAATRTRAQSAGQGEKTRQRGRRGEQERHPGRSRAQPRSGAARTVTGASTRCMLLASTRISRALAYSALAQQRLGTQRLDLCLLDVLTPAELLNLPIEVAGARHRGLAACGCSREATGRRSRACGRRPRGHSGHGESGTRPKRMLSAPLQDACAAAATIGHCNRTCDRSRCSRAELEQDRHGCSAMCHERRAREENAAPRAPGLCYLPHSGAARCAASAGICHERSRHLRGGWTTEGARQAATAARTGRDAP